MPHMLRAGSLVFTPPKQVVDLHHWDQWWQFKFGANWRRPYGPRSSIAGLANHPVVHVAYRDALKDLGRIADGSMNLGLTPLGTAIADDGGARASDNTRVFDTGTLADYL